MSPVSPSLRARFSSTTVMVFGVLVMVVIVSVIIAAALGRNFFSQGNLTVLLTSTTVLGFVTIGQTLVILLGSLDLSVPFTVSISSVLAAGVMAGKPDNLVPGIVTALAATTVIGLVNGLLVGLVKINGFIATLGVGLIVSGYLFTNYQGSTGKASPQLVRLGDLVNGFFPVMTIVMVLFFLAVVFFLTRTRTGMHTYAVGGDPAVARMSGVHNAVPIIVAHSLSGLFAGLAGLVIVARLGVGSPGVGTQGGYDLLSIAAVVLGGAVLSGGRGSLWGSLGGILIFACIDSLMGIMQLNPYLKDVVRGIVIIVAVAIYARRSLPVRVSRFPAAHPIVGSDQLVKEESR
ncbi:MAG: ribose transport system permease protein [Microbacteriaceae bacterium]|nr:ribose transport system permease protein [Microbacteriaceae bacterium]